MKARLLLLFYRRCQELGFWATKQMFGVYQIPKTDSTGIKQQISALTETSFVILSNLNPYL